MAATKVGFQLESSLASKHLTDAIFIKGGYFVVASTVERDALKVVTATEDGTVVAGSLCYCQADGKFYQYTGTEWGETTFGGGSSLPSCAATDVGKFLRVGSGGIPKWEIVPIAEDYTF